MEVSRRHSPRPGTRLGPRVKSCGGLPRGDYPWIVRTGALIAVALVGTLSSCALIAPDYGEAPYDCMWDPGELAWVGRGNPAELGLIEPGTEPFGEPVSGMIYVQGEIPRTPGQEPQRELWFCVVLDKGGGVVEIWGNRVPVPEGWQPP